ncbi:MAG TPA: hypothetical protein DCL77_11485 [Prolixibacteraceae bacterium]|jgi:hypothetical protein|nr:hypothetical protein [Prolixibacteraceae bacterium]
MDLPRKNVIPSNLLGPLTTTFVSAFPELVNALIVCSLTDVKYLKIPLSLEIEEEYYYLVELSEARLQQINGGGMAVMRPFRNPEKGLIYIAQCDKENNIKKLWWQVALTEPHWPINDTSKVDFKLVDKTIPYNLIQYSKARDRFVIDFHLEAEGLKDHMQLWSFTNFLMPFTELIKTVILDHNPSLPSKELEKVINFGFSKIEINCLHGILEFDYNESLHHTKTELENITNLYYLFGAEDEVEIMKYFDRFANKKLIVQYLSMLRQIIKNKAILKTKVATPDGHFQEASFNRQRSVNLKKIIDNKIPSTSYEDNVIGVLTRIDYQSSTVPQFSLSSTTDDKVYSGIINPAQGERIPELELNFMEKEYDCKLKVIFWPETNGKPERYSYVLLEIKEV